MRHAMANRRRNNNRPNNNGGNPPQHNKASAFDSNGPDVRIRGTAFQIVEKYMTLAKDASASGDRVLAENYLQHAEHYQRLIGSWADEMPAPQRQYYNNSRHDQNAGSYSPADIESGDHEMTTSEDARSASVPQDVVVTRPARAARPADHDDDLGLPASIIGTSGHTTPSRGNGNGNSADSDDQPSPRSRRVAITAG